MKKEFDGPSFLNPQHTSFSLNNGKSYQKPNITMTEKAKTDDQKEKKKPRGGKKIYLIQAGTTMNQLTKQQIKEKGVLKQLKRCLNQTLHKKSIKKNT
jgi:hypothetical protein